MHIHHLKCASMRPFGFILSDTATLLSRANLVVHCLLVETQDGLVLVDSGYGIADRIRPTLFGGAFMALSSSSRDLEETAAHHVAALGYRIEDVRHIVQTHLHLDHAGGLPDFPHAKVHVSKLELEAASQRRSFSDLFYLPAHWAHDPQWVAHQPAGQEWFGFEAIRVLEDISLEIWLVPLPGHTRGHCGVAVRQEDKWLLHCGDAYISRSDIDPGGSPRARPGWMKPLAARLFPHIPRLRTLHEEHGDEIEIFCAHDPDELARMQHP